MIYTKVTTIISKPRRKVGVPTIKGVGIKRENFMENKNVCGEGCKCGACGMSGMGGCGCHGGKHHLVKMILKIIIVVLIFWCGFKLGNITGAIRATYGNGYGMMRGYYNPQ
jgi:hypothetical protein